MSAFRGKDYKNFICPSCQLEKPLAKRVVKNKFRVSCSDCIENARLRKPLVKESHLRVVESDYVEIPPEIMDSYRESLDAA